MTQDMLTRPSQCGKNFDSPSLNSFFFVPQPSQAVGHNVRQLHTPYRRVSHVVWLQTVLEHTEDFETYQAHADPMGVSTFKLLRDSGNYATVDDLLL